MVPAGVKPLAIDAGFSVLSRLSRFNAMRHRREKFSAPWLLRVRFWSSLKLTSNCQCSLFSTDQCPRDRAGHRAWRRCPGGC